MDTASSSGTPTESPAVVEAEIFRAVMGAVATPVSVVTTLTAEGPHGTTVSAFASLSLDPPMVLVSLDNGSRLLALIRETGRFGLNILASHQGHLAMQFARKGADKFDAAAWSTERDVPKLEGVAGWLACEVADLVPGGDHTIALGNVVHAEHAPVPPLTYHQRSFGTHSPLPAGS